MINSWHYNYYKDKSVINELLDLIDEGRFITITTVEGHNFTITDTSDVNIGANAMMIAEDNNVSFINTDKIIYVQLIGAFDKE